MKKTFTALIVLVLLASVLLEGQPALVNANFLYTLPELTIKSDGTVEPETEFINRTGNIYALTSNILARYALVIQCSDVVFDGGGYVLNGTGRNLNGPFFVNVGLTLQNVSNVTVKDVVVSGFSRWCQLEISDCYNCSFFNVNSVAVLSGGGSNVFSECPLYLQILQSDNNLVFGSDISLSVGNSTTYVFGNNLGLVRGSDGMCSVWDNGSLGNYWSDYFLKYPNASEVGNTGIGDTPYVIDAHNVDHYPLMYPVGAPEINVICTENATFFDSFPLNFTVNKPIKWASYSLDGASNVSISGNTTISGMPAGTHNISIYAKDVYGFEATSNTITFTITAETTPFPIVPIALSVSILAVIACCVIFLKKINLH